MMYLKSTLSVGEKIELVVRLHWFAWFKPFVFALVTLALLYLPFKAGFETMSLIKFMPFIVSFLLTFVMFLDRKCIEMICTNKRVVIKWGVLSVKTDELKRSQIESIELKQSFMGRMFGYGDIVFSGVGTNSVAFVFVRNVKDIKKKIEEA